MPMTDKEWALAEARRIREAAIAKQRESFATHHEMDAHEFVAMIDRETAAALLEAIAAGLDHANGLCDEAAEDFRVKAQEVRHAR